MLALFRNAKKIHYRSAGSSCYPAIGRFQPVMLDKWM